MVLSSVRAGFLLALIGAFAIWASGQQPANAQPYQSSNLPFGVLAAQLGSSAIDLETVPVITTAQPVITGQVAQGGSTVEITVASDPISFTALTDTDGRFSAQVPQPLDDGQHSLYFNGALVGQFTIMTGAAPGASPTPGAPSTGSGGGTADSWPGGEYASILLALGGGLVAASSVVLARNLRRRPRL